MCFADEEYKPTRDLERVGEGHSLVLSRLVA